MRTIFDTARDPREQQGGMVHFAAVNTSQTFRRIPRHLPALALFALFAVASTWPLVARMDDTLVSWGDPVFQTWTLAWDWHALRTNPRDIFDANIFYPWRNTLAYSDHLFGQALLVLPVLALADNPILANNLAVLLALVLSALAMYLLTLDLTGNRGAAILAGIAYAFTPARMAHLEHLHLLSAMWPPLVLLFFLRATSPPARREGWRRESLFSGMQALFGRSRVPGQQAPAQHSHPPLVGGRGSAALPLLAACVFAQGLFGIYFFYFTLVLLLMAGGVVALFAARDRDRGAPGRLLAAAGACAVAGLLLLPVLLPYQRVHDDLGVERTLEEVSYWRAEWRDYLAVAPSNRLYNGLLGENHRDVERDLFPGAALLGLAALGLAHRRAGRVRWLLLALALGSVALSLGPSLTLAGRDVPLPYRALYDWLPGFRAIRVPARFGLLALVGLAPLAGLGADLLWQGGKRWVSRMRAAPQRMRMPPALLGTIALGVGLALLGLEALTAMNLPGPLPPPKPHPEYGWMRANPAPTLELPMGEGPVASAWPNYWSMLHWNQVVNGYSGLLPPSYFPLRERMRAFPDAATVRLLQGIGVTTVVVHEEMPPGERARLEAAAATFPQLTLALPGPDAVYTLVADPWMWRLAGAVPPGADVDLPAANADPLAFGLLLAILQREGHTVYGSGQLDYYAFQPAPSPRCYTVLPSGIDPTSFGYPGATVVLHEPEMTLYRRAGCE